MYRNRPMLHFLVAVGGTTSSGLSDVTSSFDSWFLALRAHRFALAMLGSSDVVDDGGGVFCPRWSSNASEPVGCGG